MRNKHAKHMHAGTGHNRLKMVYATQVLEDFVTANDAMRRHGISISPIIITITTGPAVFLLAGVRPRHELPS